MSNSSTVWSKEYPREFATILCEINSTGLMQKFLRDVMTESEITEVSARFAAAKMLFDKVPYTEISAKTGLSTRTIARISEWIKTGTGGYSTAINQHHRHQ